MTAPPRQGKTWIKICGIKSVGMARIATEAGADAIGLVFAKKSPRVIELEHALLIAESLPKHVTPVALFQNPTLEEVAAWPGEWIQLHGDEDEQFISSIKGKGIIKGFRFSAQEISRWNACEGVDVLLVDGSSGGGGESFDHRELIDLMEKIDKPVVLAGGLTPGNVADAITAVKPFGVDVSSGVEAQRGVKDGEKVRRFCEAVRG